MNASPANRSVIAFGLILCISSLCVGLFAFFEIRGPYSTISGQVTDLNIGSTSQGRSTIAVSYGYEVNGRQYSSIARLQAAQNPDIQIGDTVSVHYSNSNPGVSQLSSEPQLYPWIVGCGAALLCGIAMTFREVQKNRT